MCKDCRHIMPDGRRCHSPALHGMAYCYHHHKLHHALNRSKHSHPRVEFPPIENCEDVKFAITRVCEALGQARIDKKRAGLMIFGLQTITKLVVKAPKTAAKDPLSPSLKAPTPRLRRVSPRPYHHA